MTAKILKAVDEGFEEQVGLILLWKKASHFHLQLKATQKLISIPSLRGNEQEAQTWMAGQLKSRGLTVEEIPFDFEALAKHPGAGKVDHLHSKVPIVVGTYQPRETTGQV
jgi:acetylornithine deacetylase